MGLDYGTDKFSFSGVIDTIVEFFVPAQKIICDWVIQDEKGKPLRGVNVTLTIGREKPITMKTDSAGRLHLERPMTDRGRGYTLVVKKPVVQSNSVSPDIPDKPDITSVPASVSAELGKWYNDLETSWKGDNHNGQAVPPKVLAEIKNYRAHVPKVNLKWSKWSKQYGWVYAPAFADFCKPKEWPLLDNAVSKLSGRDKRVAQTLKYYLEVEGGLASVQTYDNMTITWGPGIAMGGAFNSLWTEISSVEAIKAELMKCGFFYKNGIDDGKCHVGYVDETTGKVVFSTHLKSGEKRGPAFDALRGYNNDEKKSKPSPRPAPAIIHVMAHIPQSDATKQAFADAYVRAQVQTYAKKKGDPAGVSKHWEKFYSLSLMAFVCHLNHWGPGHARGKGKGVVNEVMATLKAPTAANSQFDIEYAKAHYNYMLDTVIPYLADNDKNDTQEKKDAAKKALTGSLNTDYKKFLIGLGKSVDGITFPDITRG
jgi:hypothetical protein